MLGKFPNEGVRKRAKNYYKRKCQVTNEKINNDMGKTSKVVIRNL